MAGDRGVDFVSNYFKGCSYANILVFGSRENFTWKLRKIDPKIILYAK